MRAAIKTTLFVFVLIAVAGLTLQWRARAPVAVAPRPTSLPKPALETAHYAIVSTADATKTQHVAETVESLHTAYREFFGLPHSAPSTTGKLRLVLYRDQREFKAHNRSAPWAEAYYLPPACHAYYAEGSRNPYHWMLHEATHQLAREVSGFSRYRWSDEGLASYFGSSRLRDGKLRLGEADPEAYPIWWLPGLELSGNLQQDIHAGRIIPLRQIITDTGPPIAQHVNLYYIEYWSLTHYLLQDDEGRLAAAFKALLAEGATLANFEKRFGSAEAVEERWYRHLLGLRREASEVGSGAKDDLVVPVQIGR